MRNAQQQEVVITATLLQNKSQLEAKLQNNTRRTISCSSFYFSSSSFSPLGVLLRHPYGSSGRIQILQRHLIAKFVLFLLTHAKKTDLAHSCVWAHNCACAVVCYQQVHHVWLVVPQCLDGVEDVDAALLPQHLAHDADAAEDAAAATTIPVGVDQAVISLFTTRWRKSIMALRSSRGASLRVCFAEFLCVFLQWTVVRTGSAPQCGPLLRRTPPAICPPGAPA